MAFLDSMNISASALTATRLRMDVIAENMANSSTTRTAEGGPYRRKFVVFQEIQPDNTFGSFFNRAQRSYGGVRVTMIGEDQSEFKLDYNPNHPDADEFGYVQMPNVEVVQEMVDMMAAYRAYEANITAVNTFKDMAVKTLEIGK
ncbi:MAG: flagellar basal body rod protein FlgC [Oscillospiraceae bacterium]|jgi:flagellar basal-body rod protein FlgC|nr:flagellar basal body rod protein FlgC [Oscillospiraceae bacterium]